jgi:hypothetical protein
MPLKLYWLPRHSLPASAHQRKGLSKQAPPHTHARARAHTHTHTRHPQPQAINSQTDMGLTATTTATLTAQSCTPHQCRHHNMVHTTGVRWAFQRRLHTQTGASPHHIRSQSLIRGLSMLLVRQRSVVLQAWVYYGLRSVAKLATWLDNSAYHNSQ